jgi:hypothetical protein
MVGETIFDLLHLPAFGVPRVEAAPSLAVRYDAKLVRPQPPALNTVITQPVAPLPRPLPVAPPPWTGSLGAPMPPLVANGGKALPAPDDVIVHRTPPPAPKP